MIEVDWRTMPSLASLRAFELTARIGNFAAAARELNVTHAAIAQRVRALEEDLGLALAQRSGRTVVLTEAGAKLAQRLNDGFGTIAEGIKVLKEDEREAPLQITSTVDIAQAVILPQLPEFWRVHPDVHVAMIPSQDVVDILSQGLDMAIRATRGEPNWPGLRSELLVESELIAVGAPSLLEGDETDSKRLPWIWTKGIEREEVAMRAFGLDPSKTKNVDIGVPSLQLSLARQGLGLTFTTEILVRNDIKSGVLARLPIPSPLSLKYFVLTPKNVVNPKAEAFISWLRDIMVR